MASHSSSPTNVSEQSELLGKIEQYKLLKQVSSDGDVRCKRLEAELQEEKDKLRSVQKECKRVHDDLLSVKSIHEYSALFENLKISDETPIEAAVPVASLSTILTRYSVTQMILNAAEKAKNLEHRNEMLQVMLREKDEETENLRKQLQVSDEEIKSKEDHVRILAFDIEQLKEKISSSSPTEVFPDRLKVQGAGTMTDPGSTDSPPDISLETTVEPTALHEKIKELKKRVTELMKLNVQWNERCEGLKQEVEDAQRRIEKYERQLQEEREKTQQATVEKDALQMQMESEREEKIKTQVLCRQLSEQVTQLEARVQELERQLADTEYGLGQRQQRDQQEGIADDLVAVYQIQLEEYEQNFQQEKKDHDRTKEQFKSLEQQWKTLSQQLKMKKDELEKANGELKKVRSENEKLKILLNQAKVDRTLIEGCLESSGARRSPTSPASPLAAPGVSPNKAFETETEQRLAEERRALRPTSRGKLEPDGKSHYHETTPREGFSWTCAICTFVNTNSLFVTSCEICQMDRTGYEEKRCSNSSLWSSCSRKPKSSRGGSGLEEDGIATRRFVSVFN